MRRCGRPETWVPCSTTTISVFPDFTQQVQEAKRQFFQGKQQVQDLKLDYNILYPAQLRVIVKGRALIFTDPKELEQFIAKKEAKGLQQNVRQSAVDTAEEMDDVE
ncbi:hypothetical protein NDU88_006958 [Pleurodeles waltl]|uniref:Uncharacterized protein n=1 Tax=Pleurodeles waltl TaxID=8319 RepID=A0AAV7WFG8_PLEWA|nr:hypothetical protein NDU88_006958 [Pleurodeles waltl]